MHVAANEKQIPFGNDKQKGTGKGKIRFLRFAAE